MKKYFKITHEEVAIALIVSSLLFGCQNSALRNLVETREQKIERLGYNFEKDRYIDSIINTKPKKVEKLYERLSLYYDEVAIVIYLFDFVPYERKGEWSFYCTAFSGEDIIIQSPLGIPEHEVSPKTIDKLKQIYLTTK